MVAKIQPETLRTKLARNGQPVRTINPVTERGAMQAAFFARMGGRQQFQALFDHLPGVIFFAKDREGRFVAASAPQLERVGLKHEWEFVGLTDADIHPERVAREIREDDLRVMESRVPLIDRVEALYIRSQAKDWYLTTKLPIFGLEGEVIGVMGFVRPYQRREAQPGAERMERVVAYIHQHHAERLEAPTLARLACVSVRQLLRLFHEVFGMSPQTFLIRTRVQAASDDLLLTNLPLSEIALAHGFSDQSAFTRRFTEHVGETPLKFRKRHFRSAGSVGVDHSGGKSPVRLVQKDGSPVQDPGAEIRLDSQSRGKV